MWVIFGFMLKRTETISLSAANLNILLKIMWARSFLKRIEKYFAFPTPSFRKLPRPENIVKLTALVLRFKKNEALFCWQSQVNNGRNRKFGKCEALETLDTKLVVSRSLFLWMQVSSVTLIANCSPCLMTMPQSWMTLVWWKGEARKKRREKLSDKNLVENAWSLMFRQSLFGFCVLESHCF